ncbi:AraC family transcriptional regulator [Zhouia spongiae]|uniref:AraC family transcriptional regulator n=1 Tax=Zhouia spongiae TaxID=2202721 RepID=A0ABY3YLX6_9FLAO|nr:AraC family transcriptional regulator [Zhouia spongiae]UNY98620.1 AraC family transcriptional regulator [Zhouia spongiae]
MDNPENKTRLEKVYLQLLEMYKGNFSYSIERSEKKDELEALTALINMTTEEIRDSFLHQGYVNFHDSYALVIQILFILNKEFRIEEISGSTKSFLGFKENDIWGKLFEEFLSTESQREWGTIKEIIDGESMQEASLQLSFITNKKLLFPAYCRVIKFSHGSLFKGKTIVTTFDMVQKRKVLDIEVQKRVLNQFASKSSKKDKQILHISDLSKIRAAGEYIKNHLDEELPSLKEMAHDFGTNEFKLKRGFKELNGMTVFQFLKEERLRKAHVLVEFSEKSFKEIAKMVGFKNGTHFSREFNKRYGYRPKTLRSTIKKS